MRIAAQLLASLFNATLMLIIIMLVLLMIILGQVRGFSNDVKGWVQDTMQPEFTQLSALDSRIEELGNRIAARSNAPIDSELLAQLEALQLSLSQIRDALITVGETPVDLLAKQIVMQIGHRLSTVRGFTELQAEN